MKKSVAPEPSIGHLIKQGYKHKITISRHDNLKRVKYTEVTDFRGKITNIISSAFDAHFVNATGDRLLFTLQNREGGKRGDVVDYHGWVKWDGYIWVTCQKPTAPRVVKRKNQGNNGSLFDER